MKKFKNVDCLPFKKNAPPLSLLLLAILVIACAPSSKQQRTDSSVILNFESATDTDSIHLEHAKSRIIDFKGSKALRIDFDSKNHTQSWFSLKPEYPWDWSDIENVAVLIDIANPGNSSTHLYVYTYDNSGGFQLRNIGIPANSSKSYIIELQVPSLELNTGIRNNPPSWNHPYEQVIWRGGTEVLNLTGIKEIAFKVLGVLEKKSLIIDNVRLIKPHSFDDSFLVGLVDKFGQNAKRDFPTKVDSVEQLLSISHVEQSSLRNTVRNDRSRFNGWLSGPKLDASGYFRTEKHQGKWSLVDPEGYLFYSNGLSNIRMANTSTITGYDFAENTIQQREADDLSPEDSIGLNRAPKQAWPTRYVSSKLRTDMFTWLPEYGTPDGTHFGYRREVHSGAIEQGETYSFYRANLSRKFDIYDEEALMEKWRDTTINRMHTWGFTSFGNWVDPGYYQLDRLPYFANGWIIGNFKTVSSGNDYWGQMPDPFDPIFGERVEVTVKQIADEVQDSPWCVGVFIDNEKSWGSMGSVTGQYGIVIHGLKKDASESPLKTELLQELKTKYTNIQNLNQKWQMSFESWDDFGQGFNLSEFTEATKQDLADLTYHYADAYFKQVDEALNNYLPNHLYMGPRFAHWAMTPETRRAAAKYVDVMSYNYYREGISDNYWGFLKDLDMPSIIGEFHNGAMDSGLLNPGLIHAESQTDRGKKYTEYVNSALDNPYFVGTHWFQYIDSPLTGRAYDGENYNVGFVSVTDIPYQPLVDAASQVNRNIYTRRYSQ